MLATLATVGGVAIVSASTASIIWAFGYQPPIPPAPRALKPKSKKPKALASGAASASGPVEDGPEADGLPPIPPAPPQETEEQRKLRVQDYLKLILAKYLKPEDLGTEQMCRNVALLGIKYRKYKARLGCTPQDIRGAVKAYVSKWSWNQWRQLASLGSCVPKDLASEFFG